MCLLSRTCACRRTCTLCVGCAACARIPHIGSRGREVREGTERLADGGRRSLQRAHARRNMQHTTCIAIDQRVTVSDALQSIGYSVRHSMQHAAYSSTAAQQCNTTRAAVLRNAVYRRHPQHLPLLVVSSWDVACPRHELNARWEQLEMPFHIENNFDEVRLGVNTQTERTTEWKRSGRQRSTVLHAPIQPMRSA